jgi:tetratricopeptide (TPR) repeat protein
LRARAWVLQNHQRFITQGLKDIDKAIQLKPNDSDLYFVKARILLQMDEAEEALPWACKAVKTLPNNVDAWIDKGTIEMKMGNFTEALKSLNRAQGLNPKSPYLDYTQGRVFMGQRQWTEALKALSKALEMDPGMRDARLDRVVINVNLKNWLSVLADTEWLEKETPKAVEVIRRRAKALAELKKYDQAIVEYSKWEHIQENQRVPHEELAKLYAIVGNTRRAEFEARQVKVFDETFTLPIYTPKR